MFWIVSGGKLTYSPLNSYMWPIAYFIGNTILKYRHNTTPICLCENIFYSIHNIFVQRNWIYYLVKWTMKFFINFDDNTFITVMVDKTIFESYCMVLLAQRHYIDRFVQERHTSIANALELRLFCTNPSIFNWTAIVWGCFLSNFSKVNLSPLAWGQIVACYPLSIKAWHNDYK